MSVTGVETDPEQLTLTLIADFDVPGERVWELWADPRLLERWWGPPGYPAKMEEHDLCPGGRVSYFMTGPEGELYPGWWRVEAVDPPASLEFTDGFANEDGTPNDEMPTTRTTVTLSAHAEGTRMRLQAAFPSREEMERLIEMGMEEGLKLAVGQIDGLLAPAGA